MNFINLNDFFSLLKTLNWIITEGNKYLEDARLGKSYAEAIQLQNSHNQFEKQNHKVRVRSSNRLISLQKRK